MISRAPFDDFQHRVISIGLESNHSREFGGEMGNRGADIIEVVQYASYHRNRFALFRRYVINAADFESDG
jgi:hypothetical protein